MNRPRRKARLLADHRGFTLIELVVTTILVSIIALVVATALSTHVTAYFSSDFRKEALDQARVAMDRMTREIRNLRDSSSVTASSVAQFDFVDADGNPVNFTYATPNITRNGATLATSITNCSFEYLRANGSVDATFSAANTKRIRIVIVATINTESLVLQSEVWPRLL